MWGHFECDGGGVLPLCGVNSWLGVPLPFTTLYYCCCPLVSTNGMNIFLNFANSITLSLIIISLIESDHDVASDELERMVPRRSSRIRTSGVCSLCEWDSGGSVSVYLGNLGGLGDWWFPYYIVGGWGVCKLSSCEEEASMSTGMMSAKGVKVFPEQRGQAECARDPQEHVTSPPPKLLLYCLKTCCCHIYWLY